MPPKIANATQVASEGTPVEATSDRPVSKPESPTKAGSPSNVRGNKRKLSGLGNPQLKKGKNQLMPDSDSSVSSSSESDSDSDSDVPQIIEPSKDIDQLSKSASSLEVRDAAMEPAPASSTASPSAETSSATSKSHGALPPKDPFPEVLDWAAKVEIAEAKKAHNKAWKTECKDKVAQKKQAKLAQLDADRLAGKPPLRGCVQCKTHHWEQDPCPPKPMASPEKEASKIKSSGVGKRKHTGAEIENSGGPSKKGKS